MGPTLPFRLKVPGKDEIDGVGVTSMSFRVHGYLHLDQEMLVVEWGGTAHVQEVGALKIRDETEALPEERLAIHVADLLRAELVGGWFRPRLRIQARRIGALGSVPSERFGTVDFWYDRAERFTAIELASALGEAIADAEAPALDDEPSTPLPE